MAVSTIFELVMFVYSDPVSRAFLETGVLLPLAYLVRRRRL
jgi:hypothetical protein